MIDAYSTPWTDVKSFLEAGGSLAFLPFGALEQHGPQLPLGTDTMVAVHTATRLARHYDALLLPAISYGDTWATSGYAGTVSLSPGTITAIAVDVGRAVAGFGVRHFVIVNGDFGNRLPLGAAARILAEEGIAALVLDYPGIEDAIARVRESVAAAPGMNHAEEIETSMVLASDPLTVRVDRYAAEYPALPPDFGLRPLLLHELSASGVFGDPSTATAAKGNALYDAVVAESIVVVDRFIAGTTTA